MHGIHLKRNRQEHHRQNEWMAAINKWIQNSDWTRYCSCKAKHFASSTMFLPDIPIRPSKLEMICKLEHSVDRPHPICLWATRLFCRNNFIRTMRGRVLKFKYNHKSNQRRRLKLVSYYIKSRLRTIWGWDVQKVKDNEPHTNSSGSCKKSVHVNVV